MFEVYKATGFKLLQHKSHGPHLQFPPCVLYGANLSLSAYFCVAMGGSAEAFPASHSVER